MQHWVEMGYHRTHLPGLSTILLNKNLSNISYCQITAQNQKNNTVSKLLLLSFIKFEDTVIIRLLHAQGDN